MAPAAPPPARNRPVAVLALALAYFSLATAAVLHTRFGGGVAVIWIANGLLLADLLVRPFPQWPARALACAAASLLATALFGFGPAAAVPLAIVNIAEAAGGAWLLRRFSPGGVRFESLPQVATLLLLAGFAVPAASGVAGAAVAHFIYGLAFWPNWLNWLAGHALGALTIAPLAVLVLGGDVAGWARGADRRDWLEAIGLLTLVGLVALLVFVQTRFPLLFLPFLPMMIAVFRLGRLGAAVSLLLLTLIGAGFTLAGHGPVTLIEGGPALRALFLQLYLATATLMALPVAAELRRRKRLYRQLEESAALHRLIADRTSDIILALEADGTIRYASPSVERIGGHRPEALVGRTAMPMVHASDHAAVIATHRQALARPDETFKVEYRGILANGDYGWFETHTRATVEPSGRATGAVSIIREVSERKARELDLGREAHTDPLTGIANRRGLDSSVSRRLAIGGPPGCIALFDLDHFKAVNDAHGHGTGDDVLKYFADLLRVTMRGSDLAARLGGEEFAALLAGADIAQAHLVCERIRTRFADADLVARDGRRLRATVSIGLARIAAEAGLTPALEAADAALYRAKAAGRNRLALAA